MIEPVFISRRTLWVVPSEKNMVKKESNPAQSRERYSTRWTPSFYEGIEVFNSQTIVVFSTLLETAEVKKVLRFFTEALGSEGVNLVVYKSTKSSPMVVLVDSLASSVSQENAVIVFCSRCNAESMVLSFFGFRLL